MNNPKQTIEELIGTIHLTLRELNAVTQMSENEFCLGQMYAYIECLEILQSCPAFRRLGLDYDIEKYLPL